MLPVTNILPPALLPLPRRAGSAIPRHLMTGCGREGLFFQQVMPDGPALFEPTRGQWILPLDRAALKRKERSWLFTSTC